MSKFLTILTAFFLFNISLSLLYSCNKDKYNDGGCGPFETEYCATLKSINITPMRWVNDIYYDTINNGQSIRYSNFVLSVLLTGEKTTCYKKQVNPFMNSAYACTPPISELNFKGTISKVSITCDNDFDDTHLKGDDLSAYFELRDENATLNKVEYMGNGRTGNHKFRLTSPPKVSGTYIFTVTYHLSDGSKVQGVCEPIKLSL